MARWCKVIRCMILAWVVVFGMVAWLCSLVVHNRMQQWGRCWVSWIDIEMYGFDLCHTCLSSDNANQSVNYANQSVKTHGASIFNFVLVPTRQWSSFQIQHFVDFCDASNFRFSKFFTILSVGNVKKHPRGSWSLRVKCPLFQQCKVGLLEKEENEKVYSWSKSILCLCLLKVP